MCKKIVLYLFFLFLPTAHLLAGITEDLLSNAEVSASSCTDENHDAYNAIDRDWLTFWEAAGQSHEWLEIDLQAPCHLQKIEQVFNQSSVWKFIVEGSADKSNWTTLVDKSKGAPGIVFAESVSGVFRYLKMTIIGSSGDFNPSSKRLLVTGTRNTIILSEGKTWSTSGSQFYCEPDKVADNNISTYWCADKGGFPQFITVDLGTSGMINGVQQIFKDYDQWRFKIEGSGDQQKWTMLLNKVTGDYGCDFYENVVGEYRYIRLTVLGSSSGFWANSCEFKVYGPGIKNVPMASDPETEWWNDTSGVIRYYCKLYKNQLTNIIDSLDILQSQGYRIIELMAPYKGGADIWAGLGATDNYDIDPSIGTMADFERLIREAHDRDMKVIFFGNIGYCRDIAPFFQKACEDERDNIYSKERKWFNFSKTKWNDQWFWSELAQAYYFSYWGNTDGANGRIPSYNFNNQEWRDECRNYLKFWADKGIDGLFLDAPEVYDGITDDIIREYIVDVLNEYNFATNAEGSGDIYRWIGSFRFNCIQGFDMYGWGGGKRSEVLDALRTGNPSGLNNKLKAYRDKAVLLNGVTWTPPMWEIQATVSDRIFEAAYLSSMGTIFAAHCGDKMYVAQDIIPEWTEKDQERFYNLMRTQNSYKGLAPSGQRTVLPTNNDQKYSAFKRSNKDGHVSALVIANFQRTSQTISVNLKNSGIGLNQIPVNLQTGLPVEPITSETYTVTLPGLTCLMLGVENWMSSNVLSEVNRVKTKVQWSIFPNPVVDRITMNCTNGITQMQVYSLTGMLLKEHQTSGNKEELLLSALTAGTYVIKVMDEYNNKYVNKIIKQ